MLAVSTGFEGNKKGQLFKNLELSGKVEASGDFSNLKMEDLELIENFQS